MDAVKRYLEQNKKSGFAEFLFQLMRERNITAPELYKKALMDRKLFSKIISVPDYKPSKKNVCALALALELDSKTSKQLIKRAGYILTSGSKFDLMIRYCIECRIYNIFDVQALLETENLKIIE